MARRVKAGIDVSVTGFSRGGLESEVKGCPTRLIKSLIAQKILGSSPPAAIHRLQINESVITSFTHATTNEKKIAKQCISVTMSANGEDTFMDDAQASQAGEIEEAEELEENKLFLV